MIVNEPASPGRHLTIPRLLIAAAALVLALQAGLRLLSLPFRIWDNVKIAQIVGVWRGLPIYPGPGEAVTDWIYGPVGPIVFGPACLGTSADAMVLLGGAINLLLAIAPLAIAVWLATRRDATATLIATVALVGLSLTVTSMFEVACVIQMEAVGLAFIVAAACAVVPSGTLRAITAAGLLLALAVWTKQTFAFGAAGLVLFTAVHGGLRRACLLAGATFAACVALAIVFFAWFDRERMWFWMIEVPSRQPWVELLTGRPWDLGAVVVEVTRHLWVAAIIAAGGAWGCRQARVSPSPIAAALLWAAAAQLPVAVAGLQKVGGTCNHLGVISLLAATAGIIMLLAAAKRTISPDRLRNVVFPAVAIAAAASSCLAGLPLRVAARIVAGGPSPLARCTALAADRPGEFYFPWQPLASFVGEGRLYHVDYGLLDLRFSGFEMSEEWLMAGLPARLAYVVCPDPPFTAEVIARLGPRLEPATDLRMPGFQVYAVRPHPAR